MTIEAMADACELAAERAIIRDRERWRDEAKGRDEEKGRPSAARAMLTTARRPRVRSRRSSRSCGAELWTL